MSGSCCHGEGLQFHHWDPLDQTQERLQKLQTLRGWLSPRPLPGKKDIPQSPFPGLWVPKGRASWESCLSLFPSAWAALVIIFPASLAPTRVQKPGEQEVVV
jgi:hypothetical protein